MQQAEQVITIVPDALSAGIIRELSHPEGWRLDGVNTRLRHLSTMINMIIMAPGLSNETIDILGGINDGIDACIALSAPAPEFMQ